MADRAPPACGRRSGSGHHIDSREVDGGIVDAVENIGEDCDRDRQADLDELGISVAGFFLAVNSSGPIVPLVCARFLTKRTRASRFASPVG